MLKSALRIVLAMFEIRAIQDNISMNQSTPHEGKFLVENSSIYYREIGRGQPIVVIHGGPDFNHNYLLPDLDRLSNSFRLIYYDQRGRGKSMGNVQPEDVSLESEMADLESLRVHFNLQTFGVLGHSWGGVLAMEYSIRHPESVSHLILLDSGPASHDDYMFFQEENRRRTEGDLERLNSLLSSPKYQAGDPDTDAEYYRIYYKTTLRQPEHLDRVIKNLRLSFTSEGIRKARKIGKRLVSATWLLNEYDLLSKLKQLHIPTLVIHGDNDSVPVVCATNIAQAIPSAHIIVLKETGHFSFVERPEEICNAISEFINHSTRGGGVSKMV